MKKTMEFYPSGVCSQKYTITLNNGKVEDIEIIGGCNGNLKGIRSLLLGMDANEAVERMRGIECKDKGTSCPDQIARAIETMLGE